MRDSVFVLMRRHLNDLHVFADRDFWRRSALIVYDARAVFRRFCQDRWKWLFGSSADNFSRPGRDIPVCVIASDMARFAPSTRTRRHMSEFNVTLARIEAVAEDEQGTQVCAVFLIERGPIGFHVPIYLFARDFDNTEMVQAAKNSLYRMFEDLADQSKVWELSPTELERLAKMNVR